MNTPKRNEDLRRLETGLSDDERRQVNEERNRLRQISMLGERWTLHPANSPKKGKYNPLTGALISES